MFASMLLILTGLLSGAQGAGVEAVAQTPLTHVVIYGHHLDHLDQDLLSGFDLIIIDEEGLPLLLKRHLPRAVLYFDMW
ncbi:MAG: hypothetical protein GY704_15770, partial [Phycisphaeraceae bacterium]|nr:hypothetical protein [Phycisphaeraceae bacterium]